MAQSNDPSMSKVPTKASTTIPGIKINSSKTRITPSTKNAATSIPVSPAT